MTSQMPVPRLVALLAGIGIAFALMAAKCETHTEFPPYVTEICTDDQDNDSDGKIDCKDADCSLDCAVDVQIFQPSAAKNDSLKITGTSRKASSVLISVTPDGEGGQATLQQGTGDWEFMITGMADLGLYTVKAIASGKDDIKDTATATFERSN